VSQQINLYNPLFRPQKKYFTAAQMALGLLILLVGAAVIYGSARRLSRQIEQRAAESARLSEATRRSLVDATTRFGPRQPSAQLQQQVAQMEEQGASRRQLLDLMGRGELGNTRGFSGYLLALSRQTTPGLWITGFQVVGNGSDMAINGRALQPQLVPEFMGILKREPLLAGQTFATLEIKLPPSEASTAGKPAVAPRFIEFSLRNAEGPAK
jgi:hypothetical protein